MGPSHKPHLTHRSRFTARHAMLLAALVGIAVLLRADEALPVVARVPGMLALAVFAIVLLARGGRPAAQAR